MSAGDHPKRWESPRDITAYGTCRQKSAGHSPPVAVREDYHQQHLADTKNPQGYCPDHGTGVASPVGLIRADG